MNHYDTLEVAQAASAETIRAAYRSLMQRYHPDRHPNDPAMAARAAQLTRAYEVLSDPRKREQYDDRLKQRHAGLSAGRGGAAHETQADTATAAALALAARRRVRAAHGVDGDTRQPARWLLGLACVVLAGALLLWWGKGAMRTPSAGDLVALRQQVESPDMPESKRRELLATKQAWIERDPGLQRTEQQERIRELAQRSYVLLDTPLGVLVGGARLSTASGSPVLVELEIPQLTLILGSFEVARCLAHLDRHRSRIVQELTQRLAQEDAFTLSSPGGEGRLKRALVDSMQASLGVDAAQAYPSTWFESPGRYGVVDVVLPKGFQLFGIGVSR